MSQVTESTKDQVALPKITVDSIMDAVSQEMTQQGNKTLASFWAKNQDKYQDFVREMATVAIEEAARQLGAQARKDRIWYRMAFNPKRFPLLVQWSSFMDKLYPRREGTAKLENWYMAGWQEVEKSGAASGKAEVIIITKNKEVFTPDKVAFLGTVATRGDKKVSLYQVTGFPVFVDRDPKSKNYTRVFTYTSKVEEIIAPNARFVSWEDGRARGAAAYTEGVKIPYHDPVLREAYSGKEPLPSRLYLDGWRIGSSEAFSKAFFAKSNPSLRNQQQKRHKATGHKRHSPLSTQVTLDTGLEEDRPSSTGSPWPGATHFEARFAERTGFGSGEAPAVRAEKIRRISQQIVQILNDTAPATISLTAHGGTLRTLVPIPGWGCAFVWAYKHRLILRSWWPAGCEVGVESAWPAEASTRIADLLFVNWFDQSKVIDASNNPLIVYHGTNADFETFRIPEDGVAYFTPREDYGYILKSAFVHSAYLSLQNPYFTENLSFIEGLRSWPETVRELKEKGYDGVIYAKPGDIMRGPSGWGNDRSQIAVFYPHQIKTVEIKRKG